jgi:hypothetical protein
MGIGSRRINSNVEVDAVNKIARTYAVDWFSLQTGLYTIGWAFGCWNDKQSIGPGSVTVLVSRPGQAALRPAIADDFVR